MKTGRAVRDYLDLIISDIDGGRLPRRRVPSWVRNLALPVAVGLSFGLGGCMGEAPAPGQGPGAAGDLGSADGFGDGEACPGPAEVCDDSRDNDLDGFTDCYDFDCLGSDACSSMVLYAAPMEQDCENGEDDDGDGNTDCEDWDCSDNCLCEGVEPGPDRERACTNDTDDDSDGAVDCDDPDCAGDPACQGSEPPAGGCGAVGVLCPDGLECVAGVCVEPEPDGLCTDTCEYAGDGYCDDGGILSDYDACALGTDCTDCGPR